MKLIKTESGSYRARKMVNGKAYSKQFDHKPTQKEINKWVAEITMKADSAVDLKRGTFEHYAESYIKSKDSVLSPSTLRGYNVILRNLPDDFKRRQMKDITAADVQALINTLSTDNKPKTVRNIHAFISPVFAMFRPDVILKTTFPQKIQAETYVPTDDEVHAVLEGAKGKSYELIIILGVYGMRLSEALCVTSDDLVGNMLSINKSKVQSDKGYVVKPYGKTETSMRTIYIDDYAADLLRKTKVGFSGHPRKVLEYLYALQDKVGVHRFKYHALRHYYASFAHSMGIPDAYIMAAGGWSSDHVLKKVYRHAQKEKEEEMMRRVSEAIVGNKK